MRVKPVFVSMSMLLMQGNGVLFDFHLLSSCHYFHEAEILCQSLGYDGFAIINSPEMFSYALRISETLRATGVGLHIGLRNDSRTNLVTWDDGTFPAPDAPWFPDPAQRDYTYKHYSVLSHEGYQRPTYNREKYALCGNHKNLPIEAHGTIVLGQQPTGVSSSLAVTKVLFYMECVLLCGQDHRCRVAEFNIDYLTCMTLGPGSFTGYIANSRCQMFVRNGFS